MAISNKRLEGLVMISNFNDGMHIKGQFLVSNSGKSVTNNGLFYYTIELRDSSGTISAKKWDVLPEDENILVVGNVIEVEGEVVKYRENLQLKVLKVKPVELDDIDYDVLLAKPPVPKEELIKRFNDYVESIKNEDCHRILKYFIDKFGEKINNYPAGVSVHHEYSSGLLMHVTSMAELGDYLAKKYAPVDRDLLITAILLHDLGKTIELEGPVVFHYSTEGKLLGHISIMVGELRIAAKELNINSEVPLLLEHMVLSHHNEPEFGSPVSPLTKEALLLTLIDNLDSKMAIVDKALSTVNDGEFTQKIYPLDNRTFYKPKK